MPSRCDSGNSTSSSSSTSARDVAARRERPFRRQPGAHARRPPTGRAPRAPTCVPGFAGVWRRRGHGRSLHRRRRGGRARAATAAASLRHDLGAACLGDVTRVGIPPPRSNSFTKSKPRLEVGGDRQRARVAHHRHRRPLLPEQQELRLVVRPPPRLDVGDAVDASGSAPRAARPRRAAGRSRAPPPRSRSHSTGAFARATRYWMTRCLSVSSRNRARSARSMRVPDRPRLAAARVDGARVGVGALRTARRRPAPTWRPSRSRRDRGASPPCRPARRREPPRASPSPGRRRAPPWSSARSADRPCSRRGGRGRGDRPTPRGDRPVL